MYLLYVPDPQLLPLCGPTAWCVSTVGHWREIKCKLVFLCKVKWILAHEVKCFTVKALNTDRDWYLWLVFTVILTCVKVS